MERDEDDQTKQPASPKIPLTGYLELTINSDLILSLALQEQEGSSTSYAMLEPIEFDSDDDQMENCNDDMDFSETREFLRAQDDEEEDDDSSSYSEELDEDEDDDDYLDVDELTYEELIALGEFIGEEKRGLSLNEIASCLNQSSCQKTVEKRSCPSSSSSSSGIEIDRCVICQVEYEEGEKMVLLPNCEHPYHSHCISKWLQIKRVCPICSTEVSSHN